MSGYEKMVLLLPGKGVGKSLPMFNGSMTARDRKEVRRDRLSGRDRSTDTVEGLRHGNWCGYYWKSS